MNVAKCWVCGNENPEGEQFCDSCGARIESSGAEPQLQIAPTGDEDEEEETGSAGEDAGAAAASGDDAGGSGSMSQEGEGSGSAGTDEADGGWSDSAATEEAGEAEGPKSGYLVFPDQSEHQIPPSQWLIGRADLAKYLSEADKANEISRGHMTVFQEGDKFFIEDGKTMVQEKPSANKTWLVRGGTKILVTGTGRNELQDSDEIDVAELVKLQFVSK